MSWKLYVTLRPVSSATSGLCGNRVVMTLKPCVLGYLFLKITPEIVRQMLSKLSLYAIVVCVTIAIFQNPCAL